MTYFRIKPNPQLLTYLRECVAKDQLPENFPLRDFQEGSVIEISSYTRDGVFFDCDYKGYRITLTEREVEMLSPLEVLALEGE